MMRIYFDIETGPQSNAAIKEVLTYKEEEFKPRGNTKKRETVAKQHEEWQADAPLREAEWYSKQINKAALNPLVGRVIGVGWYSDAFGDTQIHMSNGPAAEKDLIECLLSEIGHVVDRGGQVITYNGDAFDWPFLVLRCKVLGIDMGSYLKIKPFDKFGKTPESFIDIAKEWMLFGSRYNRSYDMPKFEELCRVFGIKAKSQGFRGDQFHTMLATNPEAAREYLLEDVESLRLLAEKFLGRVWK